MGTQLKTIQNDLTRLQIHYDELNDKLLHHKQFLGLKHSVNEAGSYLNQQEQYVTQLAKSEVDEDSVIKQTENIEKAVNEIKWREIESTLANLIQVKHDALKELEESVKALTEKKSRLITALSSMKNQKLDAFGKQQKFDLMTKDIKAWIQDSLQGVKGLQSLTDLKEQKQELIQHKIKLRDHLSNIDEIQELAQGVKSNQEAVKDTITDILQSWQLLNDQTAKEEARISQKLLEARKKEEEAAKAQQEAALEAREKERMKQKEEEDSLADYVNLCDRALRWINEKKSYLRSDTLQCDLYSVVSVQKKLGEFLLEVSSNSDIIKTVTVKGELLVNNGHSKVVDIKTKSSEVSFNWQNLQSMMKAKQEQVTKEARLEEEAKEKAHAEATDYDRKKSMTEKLSAEKMEELSERRKRDEEEKQAKLEENKAKREAEQLQLAAENEKKMKLVEEKRNQQKKLEDSKREEERRKMKETRP